MSGLSCVSLVASVDEVLRQAQMFFWHAVVNAKGQRARKETQQMVHFGFKVIAVDKLSDEK